MALFKCSECGREISDKAAACPFCGCPIQSNNKSSYFVVVVVQTIGVVMSMAINSAVVGVTQAITNEIQQKGGTVTNIVNGQIVPVPLITSQTITVYYNAPTKIYDKNCTVQVTKQYGKVQSKWIWK